VKKVIRGGKMKDWTHFQDKRFATIGSSVASRSVRTSRVREVLALVGSQGHVLDIGCNNGAIAAELARRGNHVFGADLPSVVVIARTNFPDLGCLALDASRPFPIADACLDAILSTELIEHLADDMRFLEECARVLRCGGRLVLSTPNLAYVRNRAYLLFGKYVEDPAHVRFYTFPSLKAKMARVGFGVIAERCAPYDRADTFANIVFRLRYGKQNALWYALERFLPKAFRNTIVICAEKLC